MTKKNTEIVICIGAGGVGKTTVSCVLGLHHACKGYKTLVITVDPARRLSDALSLKEKSDIPILVDVKSLTNQEAKGSLFALMPDLKKEWQDFLETAIKNTDVRRDILSNHFYQYMADGLPGSFEIICSHVLFKLVNNNRYDRIILDTPPSSHSLNFFDVPQKISKVLEQNVFRALIKSRHSLLFKMTKKLALFSGSLLEKTFERLIGSHFLSEVIDFLVTIDGLYDPMLERTKAMDQIFQSKKTRYVLIVRPSKASIEDSFSLNAALKNRGIKINQMVINRALPDLIDDAMKEYAVFKELDYKKETKDAVSDLISIYRDELAQEKDLLIQLEKEFPKVSKHKLFFTDDKIAKNNILASLLENYDDGEIYSCGS